jgi:hypothetical protein
MVERMTILDFCECGRSYVYSTSYTFQIPFAFAPKTTVAPTDRDLSKPSRSCGIEKIEACLPSYIRKYMQQSKNGAWNGDTDWRRWLSRGAVSHARHWRYWRREHTAISQSRKKLSQKNGWRQSKPN